MERNEEIISKFLLCISSSAAYFIHNLTESRARGRSSMVLTERLLYIKVTLIKCLPTIGVIAISPGLMANGSLEKSNNLPSVTQPVGDRTNQDLDPCLHDSATSILNCSIFCLWCLTKGREKLIQGRRGRLWHNRPVFSPLKSALWKDTVYSPAWYSCVYH